MIGYTLFFSIGFFTILVGSILVGITFKSWYLEYKDKKR